MQLMQCHLPVTLLSCDHHIPKAGLTLPLGIVARDGAGGVEVGGTAGPPLTGAGMGGMAVGGAAGPPLTGTGVGGVEVGGVDALDRFPPVGPSLGPVDGAVWSVWGLQGERFRYGHPWISKLLCSLQYEYLRTLPV